MNVLCLVVLLMSGLQIFNAHPALYWGEDSDFDRPMFSIFTAFTAEGRPIGVTRIFGRTFDTTGVLGRSEFNGRPAQRAFPAWLTIPSAQDLATGRVWHLFFAWVFVANGMLFFGHSLVSRHFSRDLLPHRDHWRTIGRVVREHLTFKLHGGTGTYNIIQSTVEGDGSIVGEVVHIDHFGNLVTNIDASQLPPHPRITVGGTAIDRVSDSYGDVEPGGVLAIVGSTGKLEISINRGSAAKKLFVSRTDPVRIEAAAAEL
jgi:hypothetical protein